MNYSNSLDISAIGNRSRKGPDDENQQYNQHMDKLPGYQILEATEWALDDLLEGSRFFRSNPPRNLPEFASNEVRLGAKLGQGEFGAVWEIRRLVLLDNDDENIEQQEKGASITTAPENFQAHPDNCQAESILSATSRKCHSLELGLQKRVSFANAASMVERPDERIETTNSTTSIQYQEKRISVEEGQDQKAAITAYKNEKDQRRRQAENKFRDDFSSSLPDMTESSSSLTAIVERQQARNNDRNDVQGSSTCSDDAEEDAPHNSRSTSNKDRAQGDFTETEGFDFDSDDDEQLQSLFESSHEGTDSKNLKRSMSQHSQRNGMARYAVKKIKQTLVDNRLYNIAAFTDLACEAKFLHSLRHPNIVRLRGTTGIPGTPDFGLVLDRMSATLADKLALWQRQRKQSEGMLEGFLKRGKTGWQRRVFSERLMAVFDIARGMKYLHSKRILYRDLKPENIGFNVRGDVRIFDFGLAKELKPQDLVQHPDGYNCTGLIGTRRYMAPEVVRRAPYGPPADVFSFTILMWQIFAVKTPFRYMDPEMHTDLVVVKGKRPRRLAFLPRSLQELLETGWSKRARERPDFKEICAVLKVEVLRATGGQASDVVSHRTFHLIERSMKSLYGTKRFCM